MSCAVSGRLQAELLKLREVWSEGNVEGTFQLVTKRGRLGFVRTSDKNIHLIVHLHQSSWVTRCIVNGSNMLKGIFFLMLGLNSGLEISSKPCSEQLCCHPGFAVLFAEHRQRRLSVRAFGFLEWPLCTDFNLVTN